MRSTSRSFTEEVRSEKQSQGNEIKNQRNASEHCLVLKVQTFEKSGDDSKEDPPVPMPNTEVKLFHVDDTWRGTARESR